MDSERKFNVVQAFSKSFSGLSSENNLHRASRCGDCHVIKQILDGEQPFFSHYDEENTGPVEDMINTRNRLGCTPLWLASSMGRVDAVKLLIKRNADLESPDVKAQTPLFAAAKFNRVEVVEVLLQSGANPNGSVNNVSSPLHLAARENFVQVLSLLLRYGAHVDGRQDDSQPDDASGFRCTGTTPLHMTLVYRHFDCFRILLKSGASLNVQGPYTRENSSLTLLAAIIKYACDINYAKLFVMCGGLLHVQLTQVKQLIGDYQDLNLASSRETCLDYISQMSAKPLTLMQLSRIKIRGTIGQHRFHQINQMDIPKVIKSYLLLKCEGW